jgi:hypothetical protein
MASRKLGPDELRAVNELVSAVFLGKKIRKRKKL